MGKRDPELEMLLELAVPAGLPIAPAHLTALPAPSKPFNLHIYSGCGRPYTHVRGQLFRLWGWEGQRAEFSSLP